MNRRERILSILTREFAPTQLSLRDDSGRHVGHAGARPEGETHYHLSIETAKFSGLSKVKRHQAVYAVLDTEFKGGLHALSIEAKAPGE